MSTSSVPCKSAVFAERRRLHIDILFMQIFYTKSRGGVQRVFGMTWFAVPTLLAETAHPLGFFCGGRW